MHDLSNACGHNTENSADNQIYKMRLLCLHNANAYPIHNRANEDMNKSDI